MYVLDTNVVSEIRRKNPAALAWMRSVPETDHWLSVMTIGEVKKGILSLGRKDKVAAAHLERWLGGLRTDYESRILPIDEDVILEWAKLTTFRSRSIQDGLIAATVIVHRMVLVTRNTADFSDLPIPMINPWHFSP